MLVRMRKLVMIAVAAVAAIMLLLLIVPGLIVSWDLGAVDSRRLTPAEQASATNDVRTTLLQALGGMTLVVGAILAWWQMQITRQGVRNQQEQFEQQFAEGQKQFEHTLEASRAQLALNFEQAQHAISSSHEQLAFNRETLLVDRLSKAGEQIASQDPAVRTAGIYALEQIAQLSANDRRAIAQIIAAFINSHAPWMPESEAMLAQALTNPQTWTKPWSVTDTSGRLPVPPWIADLPRLQQRALDVALALEILLRLEPSDRGSLTFENVDLQKLNLEGDDDQEIDLHGLHFPGAHFEGAYLVRVNLRASRLHGAHFEGAHFIKCKFPIEMGRAHLDRANFMNCTFHSQTMLDQATVRQVFLGSTSLAGAMLNGADLRGAFHVEKLDGAMLESADLRNADLMNVTLVNCRLQRARLEGADLRGATLSGADLSGAKLRGAVVNHETVWPDGFDSTKTGVSIYPGSTMDALLEKAQSGDARPFGDDELWAKPMNDPDN
jgi:uncharacterized protein YjbI with pentapeptide repeats